MLFLPAAAQDYSKMSVMVRRMVHEHHQSALSPVRPGQKAAPRTAIAAAQPRLTAFVRCADKELLRESGCHILASWDDIHIAVMPLAAVGSLSERAEVGRIEAGAPCQIAADKTAGIVLLTYGSRWQTAYR